MDTEGHLYEDKFQSGCKLAIGNHDDAALKTLLPLLLERPDDYRLYAVIGEVWLNKRGWKDAEKALSVACELHPGDKILQVRLANAYTGSKKFNKAKLLLDKLRPLYIGTRDEPLWACAQAEFLAATGKYDESEMLYGYCIQQVPNWYTPYGGLANLNCLLHRYDRALHCWQIRHKLYQSWRTEQDLSYGLAMCGRWDESIQYGLDSHRHKFGHNGYMGHVEWEGQACDTVLIGADGGLGDLIHFSRYLGSIPSKVLLYPQERHFEVARCIKYPTNVEVIESTKGLDKTIPALWLMYVPHVLKRINPNYSPTPILADFGTIDIPHPAVALTWFGDINHANDNLRSTRLAQWAKMILRFPQIHWFTVSPHKKAAKDISSTRLPITQYATSLRDACRYLATADAFVGVDTGHAHVTATMGKPTLCLLPNWVDARWGPTGNRTPLYPSMWIYRQWERESSKATITEMADDLEIALNL